MMINQIGIQTRGNGQLQGNMGRERILSQYNLHSNKNLRVLDLHLDGLIHGAYSGNQVFLLLSSSGAQKEKKGHQYNAWQQSNGK